MSLLCQFPIIFHNRNSEQLSLWRATGPAAAAAQRNCEILIAIFWALALGRHPSLTRTYTMNACNACAGVKDVVFTAPLDFPLRGKSALDAPPRGVKNSVPWRSSSPGAAKTTSSPPIAVTIPIRGLFLM